MSMEPKESGITTADLADSPERAHAERSVPETGRPRGERPKVPPTGETQPSGVGKRASLFGVDEAQGYRSRWDSIQVSFVDEPRRAVEQCDKLVAEAMKRLAQSFADERSRLETQWTRGEDVSTEDLRVALQRYRSFFDRLLAV